MTACSHACAFHSRMIFNLLQIVADRNLRLHERALITGKRTSVSHHHHQNHTTHSTSYYVTFQVASGDRMEFHVTGVEYGQLMEGDRGELSFQGTRFLGFARE